MTSLAERVIQYETHYRGLRRQMKLEPLQVEIWEARRIWI